MTADEIRKLTLHAMDKVSNVNGTGQEEEFRNFILREIAAQLAELVELLRTRDS